MKKIGAIKNKILGKLTESYTSGNKKELKEIISLLKENRNFRELYLFYEEIEKKYFDDTNTAKLYIEEVIPLMIEMYIKTTPFIRKIDEKLGDVPFEKNVLYENLDILLSRRTIHNIDEKIKAKNFIIEHLTTKKEEVIQEEIELAKNESLFYAVLANNFNVLYENTLDEEQKKELKSLLLISDDDLKNNIQNLKEEILSKVSNLLKENTEETVKNKLEDVRNEVNKIIPTKYNLYKLQQLKNGLI